MSDYEKHAINRRRAIDHDALLETSPFSVDEGEAIGKDPRDMTSEELEAAGIPRTTFAKAVRAHCRDCCSYNTAEVRKCVSFDCNLWPFRFGTNPWRKGEREISARATADEFDATALKRELRAV